MNWEYKHNVCYDGSIMDSFTCELSSGSPSNILNSQQYPEISLLYSNKISQTFYWIHWIPYVSRYYSNTDHFFRHELEGRKTDKLRFLFVSINQTNHRFFSEPKLLNPKINIYFFWEALSNHPESLILLYTFNINAILELDHFSSSWKVFTVIVIQKHVKLSYWLTGVYIRSISLFCSPIEIAEILVYTCIIIGILMSAFIIHSRFHYSWYTIS